MLLYEITSSNEVTDKETWIDIEDNDDMAPSLLRKAKQAKSKNKKLLGVGANAFVTHDPNDPHNITSVNRYSSTDSQYSKDDGYQSYIKAIANTPEIKNNPFIPRVRARRQNGALINVTIEKLVPLSSNKLTDDTDPKLIDGWISKMITNEGIQYFNSIKDKWLAYNNTKTVNSVPPNKIPLIGISSVIRKALEEDAITELIKNTDLIEALQFIKKVHDHYRGMYSYDIHYGNLMWRITGTMPQLVITDPLE